MAEHSNLYERVKFASQELATFLVLLLHLSKQKQPRSNWPLRPRCAHDSLDVATFHMTRTVCRTQSRPTCSLQTCSLSKVKQLTKT
jgi:hypothetical protein